MTAYPIDLIRAAFPALENSRTAYLDNPADISTREKNNALEAFIYKASRASKKVVI